MVYQLSVTIALVIFALNLLLNLKVLKRPPRSTKLPEPVPLVSVLVPARNEEANIEKCLKSLEEQDYPNLEILVLDDASSDDTAGIVERMAAADNRIRLFKGEPLLRGWAGKPFACYQLAKKARGEWLLFVDADTVHAPDMVRSVVSFAIKYRCSLLSGFPRQITVSFSQKIAIPILYFIILSWFPLWWLQRSKKRKPSLAIGQFLLFHTEAYWRIGGHKAVKSRILEDVWLGMEVARHGGQHMVVDLAPIVSCHMYRNIGSMWNGFVRWFYSVAALSLLALIGLIAAGLILFLAPFYWLWQIVFVGISSVELQLLVAFQVVMVLGMRWVTDRRFKESFISGLLHPLGFALVLMACLHGASRRMLGAHVSWKGRLYGGKSGIE